jgi:RNA polymerase sigma-70 factor (ECF subfamily)
MAEGAQTRAALERLLRALPPPQRQVVVLFDVYAYSYHEIAQATGVPVGTVKSRLHRGRASLRERLSEAPDLVA